MLYRMRSCRTCQFLAKSHVDRRGGQSTFTRPRSRGGSIETARRRLRPGLHRRSVLRTADCRAHRPVRLCCESDEGVLVVRARLDTRSSRDHLSTSTGKDGIHKGLQFRTRFHTNLKVLLSRVRARFVKKCTVRDGPLMLTDHSRRHRKVCTQNYVKGAEASSRIAAAIL